MSCWRKITKNATFSTLFQISVKKYSNVSFGDYFIAPEGLWNKEYTKGGLNVGGGKLCPDQGERFWPGYHKRTLDLCSKGLFRSSTPIKNLADVLSSPRKKMTGFNIDLSWFSPRKLNSQTKKEHADFRPEQTLIDALYCVFENSWLN